MTALPAHNTERSMNRDGLLGALGAAIALCTLGYTWDAGMIEPGSVTTEAVKPTSRGTSPIAVTASATGRVILLDREKLTPVRTVEASTAAPAPGPMLVVEDSARRVFYVGNFNGGLGRIPMDGGPVQTLDLGGLLIGSAISPDGKLLAVNGAHDLTVRLVDLDAWRVTARARVGNPEDLPRHSHMTHGLASTHPVWLRDGSGVLTEDNIHEEVVLLGRDGKEQARRRMRSGVHTFLTTSTGEILALAEGTVDGTIPPCVVVLRPPSLQVVREIIVPLASQEPAKLHHGALSPDEQIVVANMGPMHGAKFGTTVAALDWGTGKVLWHKPTVRNAGHVRFLEDERVVTLGHQAPELPVLDARTGKMRETWRVEGATALGHSLAAEPDGTVLVIDSSAGRLVRVGSKGVRGRSPALGEGVSEASLPE